MKGRGTTCVIPRRQQQCGRRRRTGTGMPSPPFGPAIIAISAGPGAGCPANRCQEWTTAPGAFRCRTDRHPGRESPHGPCCARGAGWCWPVLVGSPVCWARCCRVDSGVSTEKHLRISLTLRNTRVGADPVLCSLANQTRFACSTSHVYGQSSDLMIARPRATWSVDIITVNPQAGSRSHNVGWTQSTQRLGGRRGHPRNHLCGRFPTQHARFPQNRINRGRVRGACREAARDFWRVRSAGQSLAPDGVRLARLTKIRTRVQSVTIKTME